MNEIKMTTGAWENIKCRLKLDITKFTESIHEGMTKVSFTSLQDCADTFKKMAENNARQDDEGILDAYIKVISKKE